jgi:hypothetical protein
VLRSRKLDRVAAAVKRHLPHVVLALIVVGTLYQTLCHTEVFVDDAAISFSYSRQLAERGELMHTASSERVEGFSNPSWTVLCAIPFLLHMDPYIFARAIGLMALLASLWLVHRSMVLVCPRSAAIQLAAPLVLGMAPCVGFWTQAGLETTFVAFLLALSIHLALLEELMGHPPRSGLVLALLALTRPEGIIFAAPVAGYKLLRWWRPVGQRPPRSAHLLNLVFLLVPVALYLLWRRVYFAAWVPNTYFTKSGALELLQPLDAHLSRGDLYVLGFFSIYHLWPCVLASPLVLALRARWAEGVMVIGVAATNLAFVLWADGDWMGDFRFFAMVMPAYALLLALVVQGCVDLVDRLGGRGESRRRRVVERIGHALAVVLVVCSAVFGVFPTLRSYGRSGWVSMELVRHQGRTLELIAREHGLPRASIAVPDVGGSGLGANVHVIDTVGLVDRVFARCKGRPDIVRQYFFEEARPDFYQAHSHWLRYYGLPLHPEFSRDYVQLPESVTDEMVLLGDNYIRQEHLTGWIAEMQHAIEADVGYGLRLRGWDGPTDVAGDVVLVVYLQSDGREPREGDLLEVELRGAPDSRAQRRSIELARLPAGLFRAGTILRLRVAAARGPVAAFRIRGPSPEATTGWIDAPSRRAGELRGADLTRFVLHPRSHLACAAPPSRYLPSLGARGRLQVFESCRPIHREARHLVRTVIDRARASLDAGMVRPAIELMTRAELLAPTSPELHRTMARAAREAYQLARESARRGDRDTARALCVAALRADPRLARARSLYLDLVEAGMQYFPDRRERAETAIDRLERQREPQAVREMLLAVLDADRPLDGLLALESRGIVPSDGEGARLHARALLSLGLCERAGAVLERAHESSCETQWLQHRADVMCGEAHGAEPGCAEPPLEPGRVVSLFELEAGGLDGWELSESQIDRRPTSRAYVSGYSGGGYLRTDRIERAEAGTLTALSPEFEIQQPALSLEVGGGTLDDGVHVALIVGGNEVRNGAGRRDHHLRRLTWDVSGWIGRRARLRVEDRGTGEWGFVMLDHVRAHPAHFFDADASPPPTR